MMGKYDISGMLPEKAIGHALEEYDSAPLSRRYAVLLSQRDIENTSDQGTPKNYSKGTIDVNVGEALGIGVVAKFYNEVEAKKTRYYAGLGLPDSLKSHKESILSDGTVIDTESRFMMPFQQVMFQGVKPIKKTALTDNISAAISSKTSKRSQYPDQCGLIVNVYSEAGVINFERVIEQCDLGSYTEVFCILYHLPELDFCRVQRLTPKMSLSEFQQSTKPIELARLKQANN